MSTIEEIKSSLDIVSLISEKVQLKKSGSHHTAFCPFHTNFKTPAFVVFPATQTFKCFNDGVCGVGGDIITFVQEYENLSFRDSLHFLAERAGIELDDGDDHKQLKRFSGLVAAAVDYYSNLLPESSGEIYLHDRGLVRETISRFSLGYAPQTVNGCTTYLLQIGYNLDDIVLVGLAIQGKQKTYDIFRDRIIFPIRDRVGRFVGLSGRTMDDRYTKYINLKSSPIFDKSSLLYGLYQAKHSIKEANSVVIVEGYMDVLQAHQAGFANVVAQMGTALTCDQLNSIQPLTDRLFLCADGDNAGQQAMLKVIETAKTCKPKSVYTRKAKRKFIIPFEIKVISLPPNEDPDSIIKNSPVEWAQRYSAAENIIPFYASQLAEQHDMGNPRDKSEAAAKLMTLIEDSCNEIEKDHWVRQMSRFFEITPAMLAGSGSPSIVFQPEQLVSVKHQTEETTILSLIHTYSIQEELTAFLRERNELPLSVNDFHSAEARETFLAYTKKVELCPELESYVVNLYIDPSILTLDQAVNRSGKMLLNLRLSQINAHLRSLNDVDEMLTVVDRQQKLLQIGAIAI